MEGYAMQPCRSRAICTLLISFGNLYTAEGAAYMSRQRTPCTVQSTR
jgi:hypothetical protein